MLKRTSTHDSCQSQRCIGAAKFHIGYAGNSWNSLKEVFSDYEDNSDLFIVGLIKKSESGNKVFDRFRNRIIFPIFNKNGEVIAFGGRTIVDDKNVQELVDNANSSLTRSSALSMKGKGKKGKLS